MSLLAMNVTVNIIVVVLVVVVFVIDEKKCHTPNSSNQSTMPAKSLGTPLLILPCFVISPSPP